MAGNIKGITIELDGNSTKLTKAIDGVKRESISLQSELKEVDKLLKFSPGNSDLIAQKQQNLAKQIDATSEKLKVLKQAQQQVEAQFKAGTLPEEKYNAFQREVINTEMALKNYKVQLETVNATQQELKSKTQQLETLFKATGTSVDQYADAIGVNLLQAIKTGTASSRQLDTAIEKIGKEALGSSIDIDKMKNALKSVDGGASIKAVKKDLSDVAKEAEQAGDKVNGFGEDLKGVVAGLAAGGGIAGVVSKALDTSSLNTKIDIAFDVPEESKESVREAIRGLEAYGVDGEAALQGVQRQWALNKDASDSANAAIIQQAGVIASAYSGIDFNELIQESYEMGKSMGISQEEALGLTNHLLKVGFPAEQLDIISEYGTQLKNAGYNAEEIQSIMAAGVDTGTWNIDNLLDGLKEGRIRMAEFGQEVPKSTSELLKGTNISAKQLQAWGQDVAKGGKKGSQAMTEVAKALVGVKDETTRNALGVAIFGTMYEDQGKNITDTLLNASKNTSDLKKNQDDLNNSVSQMNADPAVQMKQAMTDMQTALTPLLTGIAELVAKIAEWVSNNSTLAAVIAAVVTAIGLIVAGFMALAPIFTVVSSLMAGLGVAFSAIAAPIAIAIAAIVALVAAGVALWKNWDSIKNVASNTWNGLLGIISPALNAISSLIQSIGSQIAQFWSTNGNNIKTIATTVWSGISSVVSGAMTVISTVMQAIWPFIKTLIVSTWNSIKDVIQGAISVITGIIQVFSSVLTGNWKQAWEGVKQVLTGALQLIWGAINLYFVGKLLGPLKAFGSTAKTIMKSAWNGIKTVITSVLNALKSAITNSFNLYKKTISTISNSIKTVVSSVWNGIKTVVSTVMGGIKNTVSSAWNGIKSVTSSLLNGIKNIVSNIFNSFKSVVSTAMSKVKGAIETGWNAAKSFLSSINLTTIGKNIIQGLVNGIKSAGKLITSAVQSVANAIPEKFKKILGIHSPSRVMRDQVGYWITEGLAKGIEANTKAEKVAKAKAQRIMKAFKSDLKDIKMDFSSGKINNSQYVSQLNKLKKQYSSYSTLVDSVNTEIKKAETKKTSDLKKQYSEQMKDLKNNYNAGIITNKQYINALVKMKKQYGKKITNAESEINAKINDLRESAAADKLSKYEKQYNDEVKYNDMTMVNQVKFWEKRLNKFQKNSEEYLAIQDKIKDLKYQSEQESLKATETYIDNVKKLDEDYVAKYEALTAQYTKAVDDRAKSLYSFAGLFDEITQSSEVSGEQLLANLQGQVTTFEQWQQSLANLKGRGVSDGLIEELQEMGPKSAAEIAALNTLTEDQLNQYEELWKKKSELARNEAVSELEGLQIDTANKIIALREETATKLEEYQQDWKTAMGKVVKSAKNEVKAMPEIGAYAIQGLINGLNSKKNDLAAVMAEIAAIIASVTRSELDIHSPSRVMKRLGEYTNEGFIVGLQDSFGRLKAAMSNMYGSLANSAQSMMAGSSTVNSSSNSYDYSKRPTYVTNVYPQNDSAITRAVRREYELMAFKL